MRESVFVLFKKKTSLRALSYPVAADEGRAHHWELLIGVTTVLIDSCAAVAVV